LTQPKEMCVRIGLGGVLGAHAVGGRGQTRAGQSKGYADGAAAEKCKGASKLLQIIHSPVCDQSGALVQIDTAGFRMVRGGLATRSFESISPPNRGDIESASYRVSQRHWTIQPICRCRFWVTRTIRGGWERFLMQNQVGGLRKPVAYASRRLDKHERNYPVFLAEMQAAVFGMEQFHHFLITGRFALYTDHCP
jgi:hypothetical protein